MLLVTFNPNRESDTLRKFRDYYSIDSSVQIAGPLSGNLDNAGDTVRLTRPDYPPAWEPHHFPNVVEDEVSFDDTLYWPDSVDGQGDALHRIGVNGWGNDPNSWRASRPTPGTVDMAFAGLVISELNYDPHDPTNVEAAVDATLDNDDFEFIELLNFGDQLIDLGDVQFVDGIEFDFAPDTLLAPGETV